MIMRMMVMMMVVTTMATSFEFLNPDIPQYNSLSFQFSLKRTYFSFLLKLKTF